MNTTKTLLLAAFTAISVGMGAAMAQETPGGVGFGPYETEQLAKLTRAFEAKAAAQRQQPQYGSSDVRAMTIAPVLQGGDGGGR
jgi:hypothetical protein